MEILIAAEQGLAEINGALRLQVGAGISRTFRLRLAYRRSSKGRLDLSRPPDTYETGGRFPRGDPDRHIEADGRFCLWHPLAAPTDFDGPDGLALHLDRVRQFLLLQLTYEDRLARGLTPTWPGPEWKHGRDGDRQWVREHLGGVHPGVRRQLILSVWRMHSRRERLHPAAPCPCGSPRIWKTCHATWARPLLSALSQDAGMSTTVTGELLAILEDDSDLAVAETNVEVKPDNTRFDPGPEGQDEGDHRG